MNADTMPTSAALIIDWLETYAGSERVLEQMISLFPQGEVFTAVDFLPERERHFLQGKQPVTSFVQHWPFMRKHFRKALPLLTLAIEQLDVSAHELVLSSSHAIAKGVITGPDQLHIAYVHSPMRYAWDMQHQYLRDAGLTRGLKSFLARAMLHRSRMWDLRTVNGVDHFIANSQFIARRIKKVYGREAQVIYPPVDVHGFDLHETKEDFYLTASRMVPYKKMPEIVAAFAQLPERRLVVIGDGSEMHRVKAVAGKNVEIVGYQSTAALRDYMQHARAFVFAAEEDFGITPVEAQACGTPVIAYGRGGALESIQGLDQTQPTGLFFAEQTPAAIAQAVRQFEQVEARFSARACRDNALRFAPEVFREKYAQSVREHWAAFRRAAR